MIARVYAPDATGRCTLCQRPEAEHAPEAWTVTPRACPPADAHRGVEPAMVALAQRTAAAFRAETDARPANTLRAASPCAWCDRPLVDHGADRACPRAGVTAETVTREVVQSFIRSSGGFDALTYDEDLDCQTVLGVQTGRDILESRTRVAAAINARAKGGR